MKLLKILLLLSLSASAFAQQVTLAAPRGPSAVGIIKVIDAKAVYTELFGDASLVAAKLISGEAKLAMLPPNVPAKIASTGKDIVILAVTSGGMLSLLTSDPSVTDIPSLKGKSLAVSGHGATPDYVFRSILKHYKLNPEADVHMDFSLAYPEMAQSLISGRIKTALLPEPFATMAMNSGKLRRVGDIKVEWKKAVGADDYIMTVLAADGKWARANPADVQKIIDAVHTSINWVNANPADAGKLVDKNNVGIAGNIATAAIPRSAYCFIKAKEAKPSLEALFKIFLENSPESIGGKMPADGFYWSIN
ncbi:MAG: ABC transporter substrate-binding protein [Spirochaetaceae bacterium]|jgi:NitT/TauT family transport system substrate-binding protein|nr:ABC transporter substrate-binding protein [Spirochaetaceae bacterium]